VEFQSKVALITGGARGIGLSIAEALIRERASVLICGRNPATLKTALAHLHTLGGESSAAGTVCGRSPLRGLPQFDQRGNYTIRSDRYPGE